MFTKTIPVQILVLLLLGGPVHAQNKLTSQINLSKPYWFKYSLIYLAGCQPKVFPDNIIFNDGPCRDDPYAATIFRRGIKVQLRSVTQSEGFAKIKFRYWPEAYEWQPEQEILLKYDSIKNFNRSFRLLFSKNKVPGEYRCPNELTTKQQVIQCLGYPITVTKEGDVEKYFYILEFVGPNPFGSYDGFWVEIKGGKFKRVTGYI